MSPKVIISGAGITGLVAALYCHSQGVDCEVYESRSVAGGILQDWLREGDWFFRNCQYVSPGTAWFDLLPKQLLQTFPHTYGSFTDLWGEPCAFKGFAGPVYSGKTNLEPIKQRTFTSLAERLGSYPRLISRALLAWVERFNLDPMALHHSGALGLQVSKVFPLYHGPEVLTYKKTNKAADEMYGLPRSYFGLAPALAALPSAGFSEFFRQIENHLREIGVPLRLNNTVKTDFIGQAQFATERPPVLWTGNPTPLVKNQCNYRLESPSFKMLNVVMKWDCSVCENPYYIQVFSKDIPITRIFIYFNKATVECMDDGSATAAIVSSSIEILRLFGFEKIGVPLNSFQFSERRYFLTSVDDFNLLRNMVEGPEFPSWIPAPWHRYGRDVKIEMIMDSLNKRLCLKN